MPPVRTIMVTTDFSEFGNQAIPYAGLLARKLGARLFVAHVIDLPPTPVYENVAPGMEVLERRIQEYAGTTIQKELAGRGPTWETLITTGNPADQVARLCRQANADLVVAATHGRSGLERLLLGSVTEQLMHTLPCPLLAVRGPVPKDEKGFGRILVGVDFSPDSKLAVDWGRTLAQAFEAELHLAHVIPRSFFTDYLIAGDAPEQEPDEGLMERIQAELATLATEDEARFHVPTGDPHKELVGLAAQIGADLLILGVHGMGFVETLLVGSTTDRVVRTAAVPVLSVRPKRTT
jgi:nucleotide-binding universal stress UspA family protein